jgi:hypothetical protein
LEMAAAEKMREGRSRKEAVRMEPARFRAE